MDSLDAIFGAPLQVDPAVALPRPQVLAPQSGPAYAVQLVAEVVGPRSMPAALVRRLLSPDLQGALGSPELFVMRASDVSWQRLTDSDDGSYDSLVAAWDLLSDRGQLSANSASQLVDTLEGFAQAVQRRVIPLPIPTDIAKQVQQAELLKENLDVGVTRIVVPRSGWVLERDLWLACAALGLEFSPTGSFDWRAPNHASPLFSVTRIGVTESFSLGAVKLGATHEGVSVGFSLPLSPDPIVGFEGMLNACAVLAQLTNGIVADEEGSPTQDAAEQQVLRELREPVRVLTEAGIAPGSAAATKLFG